MANSPGFNVVLVVLDCVRYQSLHDGRSGVRANTPNIDRVASGGVDFVHAVSPSNWTIPSHASILSGLYPPFHGLRSRVPPNVPIPSITSEIESRGYETTLFSEQRFLTSGLGLERGFQSVTSPSEKGIHDSWRDQGTLRSFVRRIAFHSSATRGFLDRFPVLLAPLCYVARAGGINEKRRIESGWIPAKFDKWLSERDKSRPFFSMVNITDAHEPFVNARVDPPTSYVSGLRPWMPTYYVLSSANSFADFPWSELEGGYVRAIEDADRKLGIILDSIERNRCLESTWVIVTSDHGQQFGERGLLYHGMGVTNAVSRVPLVVMPPAADRIRKREDRWISLTEIPRWLRAILAERDCTRALVKIREGPPQVGTSEHFVYCEGAPPSDYNPLVGREGADSIWNRRLYAAYNQRGKFVLDHADRVIYRWLPSQDPDYNSPLKVVGEDFTDALARVFGPLFGAHSGTAKGVLSPEPPDFAGSEVERRLLAWGYS